MPTKKQKWVTHVTDKISIQLPENFIAGSPSLNRKELKAAVAEVPEEFRRTYKTFFSLRNFDFLAASLDFKDELTSLTCLVVIPQSIPFFLFNTNVEKYIDSVKKNNKNIFINLEEDYFEYQGFSAARLLSLQHPPKTRKNPEPEPNRKHLHYVYQLKRNFWAFDYIADVKVFDKYLDAFEKSIKTLEFHEKTK